MTSVIIPSTVTQIDEYAFDYCTSLSHIVSGIQQPFTIDKTVFDTHSSSYSVYSQATLVVPDGSRSTYKSKSGWTKFTNIKEASEQKARTIHVAKAGTLPDYISDIEKYKIEELTITGELNGTDFWLIRDMAGTTCKTYEDRYGEHVDYVSTNGNLKSLNLSGVDIVEGGSYIIVPYSGPYTFTEDITDVLGTIDNTISRLMFYLTKLESIVLPQSITSIASDAFNNCSFLNSLMIESGNPYYESPDNCNAIIEKSSNKLIAGCNTTIIPANVTSIGDNAFYGRSGLTDITIPNNLVSVGSNAFYGTAWYENQPDGLIYLGKVAYKYKGVMPFSADIIIKDGTLEIAANAFSGCKDLHSIFIPNGVTSIGRDAFEDCSGLSTIIIPKSMKSMGHAFYGCGDLVRVVSLRRIPPSFGYYFENAHELCTVWVPKGCAAAYRESDDWKNFMEIREIDGDVNLDNNLDEADLNAMANRLFDKWPSFYGIISDLNGDDKLDVADVVKLVTILNIQDGLSPEWQMSYNSSQVVTSLSCTLKNDGDNAIQLTKCELYCNQNIAGSANFKVTLSQGDSKSCTFNGLSSFSSGTGFSVVWYYTYNGESYKYHCDLSE